MRTKKTLAVASALAAAIALAPLQAVQAASPLNRGAAAGIDSLVQVVKAKRHARMHGHHSRMARSKRPGSCGENMYFSRKMHHCVDARDKA